MNGRFLNVDYLESILYCDCELLFAAVDAAGQRYIAVHRGEYPAGCRYGCEYAVVPVSGYNLAAFRAGKIGLRSLLLAHPAGEWYATRLGADAGPIVLARQPTPITEGCANLLAEDYFVSGIDYSAADYQAAPPPAAALTPA